MNLRGNWRVVGTPEYDMAGPNSFILFAEDGGEFALSRADRPLLQLY